VVLSLLILAAAGTVQAQTQWQGILGTNWEEPTYWSQGLPKSTLNAVIDGPFLTPNLSGTGNTQDLIVGRQLVGNLTVDQGTLTSAKGYLGFQTTGTGTVTLVNDAMWTLDELYVGGSATVDGGVGDLNVLS